MCVGSGMWRSEDNLKDLIISSTFWVSGIGDGRQDIKFMEVLLHIELSCWPELITSWFQV